MMNLDEAIKHYEELVFWLKDYKRLKEAEALDIEREQREEARRESHKIDDNEDTLKFRGHA